MNESTANILGLQQVLGFIFFVVTVFGIYAITGVILLSFVAAKIFPKQDLPKSVKDLPKWQRIVLVLAALGSLCIAYGFFVEPYWPEVTHVNIETNKLKPGSPPIRLVQISDLHCDPQVRLEEKLPGIIRQEKPDLIVFTGDSINSPAGLPVLRKCLKELSGIAPTYVIKGNWDSWYWKSLDIFKDTGVIELNNTPVTLSVKGSEIWLNGVAVDSIESKFKQALNTIPSNIFSVFLFHYPEFISVVAKHNVDLYLAGHTHGGQVALPFYGAIITLSATGKRYEAGLYSYDKTKLYVNRGIGMEGGKAPRIRFCARPEVTVIDVKPLAI